MNSVIKSTVISAFLFLFLNGNAQIVYRTPTGEKYHLASCRYAKTASQAMTVSEAVEAGLTPCKICKPQHGSNSYSLGINNSVNKKNPPGQSQQCHGITKKGARCRNLTRYTNGYCYLHQP